MVKYFDIHIFLMSTQKPNGLLWVEDPDDSLTSFLPADNKAFRPPINSFNTSEFPLLFVRWDLKNSICEFPVGTLKYWP